MPIRDNFWEQCDQSGGPDGCWPWQRAVNNHGYGTLYVDARNVTAHRHACALAKGPIPPGLVVMHSCDNRRCVNPSHLFLGTVAENNADCAAKGRNRAPRNARLKIADVLEIRRRFAQGLTTRTIAKDFHCAPSTIWRIVARERWEWV